MKLGSFVVISVTTFALLGCATAGKRARDEQRFRQARSHFDLGVDHLGNDRVALGLRELLRGVKLDPSNPRMHYALGEAYMRRDLYEEAEAHLKRALEIWPDFHDARLHLTALYIYTERYEETVRESEILIEDPTFSSPWRALTNKGWASIELGRYEEARQTLELALDYNRSYWPTLLDLGILEAEEGNRLEAISRFRQVLDLGPGPLARAEANFRLAEIYVALGKRDRAVGHLTAAVSQKPSGLWGEKSEEYLKLLR